LIFKKNFSKIIYYETWKNWFRSFFFYIFFWCAPFGYLYFFIFNAIASFACIPCSIRHRGSNSQPLDCESSALTTRPRLLAGIGHSFKNTALSKIWSDPSISLGDERTNWGVYSRLGQARKAIKCSIIGPPPSILFLFFKFQEQQNGLWDERTNWGTYSKM
jgi:hypothetical protein